MSNSLADAQFVGTRKPPCLTVPALLHIYISYFISNVERGIVLAFTKIPAGQVLTWWKTLECALPVNIHVHHPNMLHFLGGLPFPSFPVEAPFP